MDFASSKDEQALRDRFDALCRERIAPRARDVDLRGAIPKSSFRDLAEGGYFQLFHPSYLGGAGASGARMGHAMESLARACPSTFWAATISTVLCGKILHELCAPAHHWAHLQPIVAGEKTGCFAATEDGAGSDPASYQTTLRETPDGVRLSGVKSRISNAGTADVAVVLARDATPRGPGLCYLVVDLRRRGVERAEQPKMGLLGMSWGTLTFRDVPIAKADVIANASIDRTLRAVEWGQLLQTWCAIGIAQALIDLCVEYTSNRVAFGRPIAHLEVVHGRLAELSAEVMASRLLALDVTSIKARGEPTGDRVMIAKVRSTELSVRVADAAMRTFGGWGFSKAHAVERLYRDSLSNVPAGLPTDRLRELIGCAMVGADPWSYPAFDWLEEAGLRI
ncbi:MAG: acyl-CoA dehydrogenase family protein [Polyangiaceae bacterium]